MFLVFRSSFQLDTECTLQVFSW